MKVKKNGFSLIETLLALTISFFIILGAIYSLFQSLNVKHHVELRDQILQVINNEIEELRHEPQSSLSLEEGESIKLIEEETFGQKILLIKEVKNLEYGLKEIKISAYPQRKPALKTNIIIYFSQDLGF